MLLLFLGCHRVEKEQPMGWTVDGEDLYFHSDVADMSLYPTVFGSDTLQVFWTLDGDAVVPEVQCAGACTLNAMVVEGPWSLSGEQPARWWRQGYQSWSWSGVVDISPMTRDNPGVPLVGGDTDSLSPAQETAASS